MRKEKGKVNLSPKVLFEDEDLMVLEKPAGMVVNRATSVEEETVQDWVARNFQFPISNFQLFRNGIVHRLDKETSGLLLLAKTQEAFENLQRQFKERKVKKKYLALVHGKVIPGEGEIKAPVARLPWNRERFGIVLGGREAVTRYEVIRYFEDGRWKMDLEDGSLDKRIKKSKNQDQEYPTSNFSLLNVYPQTGRTHQIRVHLKYLGHPIVGDFFYAGRKTARNDRKFCPRIFLHASFLGFTHPVSGKKLEFNSPLPEELTQVLWKV